jgi:hypothetical protein
VININPPRKSKEEKDRMYYLVFESKLGLSFTLKSQYGEKMEELRPMTPDEVEKQIST